ncbi:MAG: biotin/lipoyl-containing protein, partial [Moraxellaceae bacterium]
PCPVMTADLRQRMGEAAVAAAKSCDYVGAGTVEFLLDSDGYFYFLEMNTRLQVEHPVTEMITGLDLVEWQLRVANGEHLPLQQEQLQLNGHAVEVRLYAEDPSQDFLPQTGKILLWQPADLPNVRIDHGMTAQGEVSPYYDSMIAKIIAYGKTRTDAVRLLARAVDDCVLLGVNSNKQFLVNLLRHPELVAGHTNTAFIAEHFSQDVSMLPPVVSAEALALAAYLTSQPNTTASWTTSFSAALPIQLKVGEQAYVVHLHEEGDDYLAQALGQQQTFKIIARSQTRLTYVWQGVRYSVAYVLVGATVYLDLGNGNLTIENSTYAAPVTADQVGDGQIRAPMDGAVVNLLVNVGDVVKKDQPVLILEAMKIQQQIRANCDGTVAELIANIGQQVKKRQILLQIQAATEQ